MAISNKDCTLLFYSKTLNVSFEKTLMLGRLKLNASKADITACVNKYHTNSLELSNISWPDEYAEPLFKLLGASNVDSLDYSGYENATIIHDMNLPVDKSLHSRYTSLVDGGTIEHVFNFPMAIMNCMNMLQVGGHYIGISPANNQMGHGFYQFCPELFYRVFSKENGFEVKKMLVTTTEEGAWYEVADPFMVKSRVMLVNHQPLSLIVIAQKIETKEIFKTQPQQSDYQTAWGVVSSLKNDTPLESESAIRFYYRKYFPKSLKKIIRPTYDFFTTRKVMSTELGIINPGHFKQIDI